MINLLSGPANISLTILFLEKVGKTALCSYVGSRICLGFQKFTYGELKIFRLFALFCLGSLSMYLILTDFTYLRQFCLFLAQEKMLS